MTSYILNILLIFLLQLNRFSFVLDFLETNKKNAPNTINSINSSHASSSGRFRGERDSGRLRRASAAAREPTRPAARFTSSEAGSRQKAMWKC